MIRPQAEPVLRVRDLTVAYKQDGEWLSAVRDFDLTVRAGETYALVGESGSGKSTVALAIMRYLSSNGRVQGGAILFGEQDLLALPVTELRRIWGRSLAMVPQDPLASLNPSLRVGEQIAETLRLHMELDRPQAAAKAIELLEMVRVPDPPRVAHSYPHEISGGMQQRVLIAMALGTEPQLLVLDEPTTALDVTTQAAVLDLLRELIRERQTAVLYVTHNLGVVARLCDRVAVLYAGELIEDAPVDALFQRPYHPYTEGLLQSVPHLGQQKGTFTLQDIPGQIPSLQERPPACVFAPRCLLAIDICSQVRPGLEQVESGERQVRCHRWPEIAAGEISARRERQRVEPSIVTPRNGQVLTVSDLHVDFEVRRSLLEVLSRQPGEVVRAVSGVDLQLATGQTLGLVGESGSGKTTMARAIVGLVERSGGNIELLGVELPAGLDERPLSTLQRLQYVFQNAQEALNPYLTVRETLQRPFVSLLGHSKEEADQKVYPLLDAVRLPRDYAGRFPGQLSGGEKQRVAIARAFATSPELLIADEPVSSLDVSVQASILNLLRDLQTENQNTLLFISHDLAVVGYLADLIAVMYAGQFMEIAGAAELFQPPYHPYTEALLSAIPLPDPAVEQHHIRLAGEVPRQSSIPRGCPFHPRCPRVLGEVCRTETPPWRMTATGDRIFCHIPLDELVRDQAQVIVP